MAKAKQQIMGKLRCAPCRTPVLQGATWPGCMLGSPAVPLRVLTPVRCRTAPCCSGSLTDPLGKKQQAANGAAGGKSGTTFLAESGAWTQNPSDTGFRPLVRQLVLGRLPPACPPSGRLPGQLCACRPAQLGQLVAAALLDSLLAATAPPGSVETLR